MAHAIVAPTPSQQAAAEQLLSEPGRWSHGRSKETGQAFWLIQGSKGTAHYATSFGCTCRGFTYRGICSHSLAVVMREAREAARDDVDDLLDGVTAIRAAFGSESALELAGPIVQTWPASDRYSALFPVED